MRAGRELARRHRPQDGRRLVSVLHGQVRRRRHLRVSEGAPQFHHVHGRVSSVRVCDHLFRAEMCVCSFLRAHTNANTNTFDKNRRIQIRVQVLPKNEFENTQTNTFKKWKSNWLILIETRKSRDIQIDNDNKN